MSLVAGLIQRGTFVHGNAGVLHHTQHSSKLPLNQRLSLKPTYVITWIQNSNLLVPNGFFPKSFPTKFAWNKELICESPGPE